MLHLTDRSLDVYFRLENHNHRRSTILKHPQVFTFFDSCILFLKEFDRRDLLQTHRYETHCTDLLVVGFDDGYLVSRYGAEVM